MFIIHVSLEKKVFPGQTSIPISIKNTRHKNSQSSNIAIVTILRKSLKLLELLKLLLHDIGKKFEVQLANLIYSRV